MRRSFTREIIIDVLRRCFSRNIAVADKITFTDRGIIKLLQRDFVSILYTCANIFSDESLLKRSRSDSCDGKKRVASVLGSRHRDHIHCQKNLKKLLTGV